MSILLAKVATEQQRGRFNAVAKNMPSYKWTILINQVVRAMVTCLFRSESGKAEEFWTNSGIPGQKCRRRGHSAFVFPSWPSLNFPIDYFISEIHPMQG